MGIGDAVSHPPTTVGGIIYKKVRGHNDPDFFFYFCFLFSFHGILS